MSVIGWWAILQFLKYLLQIKILRYILYQSLPLHKMDCTSLTFNIFNRCQAESLRPAKLSAENVKPSTQQDLFPQLFPIRDSLRSFLWYSLSSSWFDTNEWFALLGVWRRLTQRWSTSPRPVVVWWNFVLVLFKISCIV